MKEKNSIRFWLRKSKKNYRSIIGFLSLLISLVAIVISVFTFYQTEDSNKMDRIIDGINLLNSEETFPSGIYFLKLDQSLSIDEKTRLLLNAVLFNLDKNDINPFESFETANLLYEWGIYYYGTLFDINRQCFQSYEANKSSSSPEYFYCVKNSGEIIIDLFQLDKPSFVNHSLLEDIQLNVPLAQNPMIIEGLHYSNFDFSGIKIDGAEFIYFVDLKGSKWNKATINNVRLVNAQLTNATFNEATLFGMNLTGAWGDYSSFKDAKISNSKFIAAQFEYADFSNVIFSETILFEDNYCAPGNNSYKDKMVSRYLGSDFNNAKGLSEDQRRCLCVSGAINVPGGCDIFN